MRSIGRPALFILLDLGARAGPRTQAVQISRTPHDDAVAPAMWAIHSRGRDERIFPCIAEMEMSAAVSDLWAAMTNNGGLPDTIENDPKKMMRFRKLQEDYRQ